MQNTAVDEVTVFHFDASLIMIFPFSYNCAIIPLSWDWVQMEVTIVIFQIMNYVLL